METLILARHATAVSNARGLASCSPPGAGLVPQGIEEGQRLAAALAGEAIDLGVATELRRTQETLELGLAGREVPVIVVPELNEIDFGSFDGDLLDCYRAWAWSEPPDVLAPGGGESRAQGATRFSLGLRVLLARPERTILAIGHALMIRYALDAVAGLAPSARMTPVGHAIPNRLRAADVAGAARLLESWGQSPRFRDPPKEG